MKTKLILVRHGRSEAAEKGIVQGVGLSIPLTAAGREQADRLAALLSEFKFDKIFSSTALRAKETAEPIRKFHPDAPFEELSELNERSKGEAEGLLKEEFNARYPKILEEWNREEDTRVPGGENFADVHDRVVPVIEKHVSEDKTGSTYLYVIHGNVIRAIIGHMLEIPHRFRPRLAQDYCAINVCIYDHERRRWTVECLNRAP